MIFKMVNTSLEKLKKEKREYKVTIVLNIIRNDLKFLSELNDCCKWTF